MRHLIREMRRHDLTNKKTMTMTDMEETWPDEQKCDKKNTMIKTNTMTNTFREHLQIAILEICDLSDI